MTEAEWLACDEPIQQWEAERGWPSPRKQRLFAVACCRRLLRWLPDAPRLIQGLVVAERCADRQQKHADLKAVHARLPAVRFHNRAKDTYALLLHEFAVHAVRWACAPGSRRYAAQAAMNAAVAAAYGIMPLSARYVPPADSPQYRRWIAAEDAEKKQQMALLRDICGDPFGPPAAARAPSRFRRNIVELARACYDERLAPNETLDPHRLAVMADALEDAGCTDRAILDHCRQPGEHVRGCWVVDLVLGWE